MMKRAKGIRRAKLEYSSNVYNRQITEKTRKGAGVKRRKKGGQRCTANEQEGGYRWLK